ncbi:hypothetical protein [Streptomyces sp. NRRL B-24572]|uniref:hypothetical protein n=1 Tax=Streptomyces sp. NRRL B-24572 TaxID=1962156 RepID=UPI0015C50E96|nr:hypothetical protein [Streptomyces sp. NRRL B-24572]
MRSRRSARTLLLVPALLAALVGPALPTATAVAATPDPAVSASASPASAPAAQAPDEPTPEPSATTEPTPDPTPTTEPSPDPTETATPAPTTTTAPCPVLPLAAFGDPGAAVGRATLEPRGEACFTVTVEKPGLHRMLVDDQFTYPSLYSGETKVDCEEWGYRDTWCELATGTYTLKLFNTDWSATESGVSLVPLMSATDCPSVTGTGYDSAPTTAQGAGPLGVVCHAFTAAAGERITVDLRRADYGPSHHWITDDTGKRLCPSWNADGSTGCVLPEGSGGYRVLAVIGDVEQTGDGGPYTLKVRRLSNPAGCAAAPVNAYGSAPTRAAPETGCRIVTPSVTGRYEVRAIGESGSASEIDVYAADGTTVCASTPTCALTAGTPYTLVTDQAVRILDRASTEGCTSGVELATAYRGVFGAPGTVDCLNLPVPQGAHIAVLTDRAPGITVVDANGTAFCADALWDGTCVLGGTAPYRALISERDPSEDNDGYRLVVHRTDTPSACRTFTAGDFTGHPARMAVTTGAGVFSDCLTIPADGHSAHELVQIQKVSGDSLAEVSVLDANGKRICGIRSYYGTFTTCALTPGIAHTVLVQGRDEPGEFALTRLDVTDTARGCVTTPATAVGGPSTGGVPAAPGTFLCHQVTTESAGDILHLNVRDAEGTARQIGYDASGNAVCDYFAAGCAVTGSTRYQVLVQVPEGKTAAAAYRLDALRIGTAAGPAPECVKVPNVSYGFGPLTGTLSEQRTAVCAVLPTASGDTFDLRSTPAGSFDQSPTPWLYDQSTFKNGCQGWISSEGQNYQCGLANAYPRVSRPSTIVIGLPEKPAQASTAVRVDATCTHYLCGPDERTIGTVGPATVGRGKISMTVTGSALPDSAKVVLTSGSFRAESTTLSVAPDRRSMTVGLDLTNAPLGTLNTSVYAFGAQYMKPSVTVVAALRNTAAPGLSGTAVVGGKLTASAGSWSLPVDSLAYQWRANGVAIAGATASTYTLPSTLFGKQLSVAVTARKAGHPVVTATSAAVVVKGVAPKPTTVPRVSGTVRVGSKVTAVVGTWTPAPTSYAYQWRANGVAIAGATGASYVPVASTLGKKLTVTVTALRTGHLSGSYTTAGVTVAVGLAPKATTAPYVTGTVRVGRTLTLNRGAWTPAPTSYAYQWYANGRAISGATRTTFTLTSAQRGLKITVRVTAYRTGHAAGVAWTRSTGAVAG